MKNNSDNSQQAISLPKGGGAVKGIGETFQPNLFSGTGNFTIPIATSPGRAGFGPQLSLQYSTGNGNGPFGLGWNLSIPRVTRKTEKGLPTYTDDDVFVLSGAEDLVIFDNQLPVIQPDGYSVIRYRPRTEGIFARIDKWTRINGEDKGDVHWRIVTKDNVTNIYGKSKSARIADPEHENQVYEWLLEETFDNKGNHILYEYVQEKPDLQINRVYEQNKKYCQVYIRRILYGNSPETIDPEKRVGPERMGTHHLTPTVTLQRHYHFELLFDYGDIPDLPELSYIQHLWDEHFIHDEWPLREDPFSTFRPGFEVRTLRRCRRALMLHHFEEMNGAPLVRSTDFVYEVNPDTLLSLLKEAQGTGYRKEGNSYHSASMPPVSFSYLAFEPHKQRYQSVTAKGNDLAPRPLNDPEFNLIDLFGDALPDIVHTNNAGYYFWQNLGNGNIDRRRPQQAPIPSVAATQPNVAFGDMGGDGLVDLVVQAPPLAGFFESSPDGRWKPFRKFTTFPSVNLSDPNVRLLDLTGDGLSDILMTQDHHLLWYKCLGEEGYDKPLHIERVHDLNEFPDIYFNDPSHRVRLADMTGDGLNDIVLVHSGRIDYWPNLGYGRFGRRVTMAQSPRLPYNVDPRRLFLADLDGSGCADLVYVDFDSVHFWFNQSGNSWSEEQSIQGTPYVSDLSSIQFADFFGTGTTSLIWSYDYLQQSRGNYKVLDFCGGKKPYLLSEMKNNMGATTRVQYASSTKFYLEDKEAGKPWATNLPFPVQVVEKSEIIDHISKTKLVTTYKYHHGYYDGREREFRGFGRVDQYDTEEFEQFSGSSLHGEEAEFINRNEAFHVPTVLTKTWFHTGVYFDENNVSPSGAFYDHNDLMEAYKKEFYQGDNDAFLLNGNGVEHSGTPHEAYRVLQGSIIRSEVYALDGTGKAYHPYSVTENRYGVKELQEKDGNNHAVYLTTQKESISYHYERIPNDPRISQNLVLAIDEYGQVTDSLSIAYPRRLAPENLPEQSELKAIYTKTDYINKDGEPEYYYLGIPCQQRTYELTGIEWSSGQDILKADAFTEILSPRLIPGDFRPYEWQRPETHAGFDKRIIEWSRSYFRTDESADILDITLNTENQPIRTLNNRLPLGGIERLALPYESITTACTDDLMAENFTQPANVSASMLLEGGYHQEPDIEGYWWVPVGQQSFDQSLFYQVNVSRNPFTFNSEITYDDYALIPIESVDALGNRIQAVIDYRVLQPRQVTDPNGNQSFVVFNTFGLVVGTAVQSKTGEGDSLEGFITDISDQQIQEYLEQPEESGASLLARATSRMIYDLWAYKRGKDQLPGSINLPVVATMQREIHDSELESGEISKIQHSFLYSDGFGRTVQSKVQAEPDPTIPNIPRWVGTGTTIFNNKGKPVKQYEPFFSDTHAYGIEQHGVSPTLFYDPLERVICTLHPNHTYEKVVFDPWKQTSWDVNDTIHPEERFNPQSPDNLPDHNFNPVNDPDVGHYFQPLPEDDYLPTWYNIRIDETNAAVEWNNQDVREAEVSAAQKAAKHAATPTVAYMDTLGRTFLTIADNGTAEDGSDKRYETRVRMDIEGNPLVTTDARGNDVETNIFNVLGEKIFTHGMDSGNRWLLTNVAGNPVYSWDNRGHMFRSLYDELQRTIATYVQQGDESEQLVTLTLFGERHPQAEALNLRGQVFQTYDQAGIVTNMGRNPGTGADEAFDFKGNLLRSSRQMALDYKYTVDWSMMEEFLTIDTIDLTALADAAIPLLETNIFQSSTRYDALNRPVEIETPDGSLHRPTYNEANFLEQMSVQLRGEGDFVTFVSNIDYNEKGQRMRIEYGNGVKTEYTYDEKTFRLTSLLSNRETIPSRLQDLNYTYDPVGNITEIRDNAQQTIYFNNQAVAPSNKYEYDAIYQLIRASGREHIGQNTNNHPQYRPELKPHYDFNDSTRRNLVHPHDGQAMRRYTQNYLYDAVGNIMEMDHNANGGSWTRQYEYAQDSNRLLGTTLPTDGNDQFSARYGYDAHGNMTQMPHLPLMQWNYIDELQSTSKQVVNNSGTPETTYYVYDTAGQRVRKVTERQANDGLTPTRMHERIYLGGFEDFRGYGSDGENVTLERETLHIMDDTSRIALVDTRTVGIDESPAQIISYQLSNHLGSASIELDENAAMISYEEYHPYGTTSYQAGRNVSEVSMKRYRYTGKEKDEETGLYYHGARYYACWLGRWTAADPIGLGDGVNRYVYVVNNPTGVKDPSGFKGKKIDEDAAKKRIAEIDARIAELDKNRNPNIPKQDLLELAKDIKKQHAKVAKQGGEIRSTQLKAEEVKREADSNRALLSTRPKPNWRPPIEQLYKEQRGFFSLKYDEAVAGYTSSSQPLWARGSYLGAASLLAPIALVDKAGESVLNAPRNADLSGQFAGRSMLQDVTERKLEDAGNAFVLGTIAFNGLATVPALGVSSRPTPRAVVRLKAKGGVRQLVKSGDEVTDEMIREAMKDAPLKTQQDVVSVPVIRAYVGRLAAGDVPPPIKVAEGFIIEGNHRYIAGRLFGKEPAQVTSKMPMSQADRPQVSWGDIALDPVDWGNR